MADEYQDRKEQIEELLVKKAHLIDAYRDEIAALTKRLDSFPDAETTLDLYRRVQNRLASCVSSLRVMLDKASINQEGEDA